jgi:hypothetical protein
MNTVRNVKTAKAEEAAKYICPTNASEPFLSNMIHALRLCSILNTEEENARLHAAMWVKANRKFFLMYLAERRERR